MMLHPAIAFATVLGLAAVPVAAQNAPLAVGTAPAASELRGRVVDAGTGEVLAGAEIVVTGAVAGSAITNERGEWRLAPLPDGEYEVRVRAIGYAQEAVRARVPRGDLLRILLTPRAVPLDAVVVTAGRRLQRLADVVVTTEVVTRDEIVRSGASDLATVLTSRAGITLEGGHPTGSGLMLQGLGARRVLVLLDGRPLVGRIAGNFDVSRIPASAVERVEIVKGPQSTLYGSEAMGGVVNIITRRPVGGWEASADLTGGSHGRLDTSLHGQASAGRFTLLGEAGRRTIELTPGVSGETGTLARRLDGLGRVAYQAAPGLRLEAGGLVVDERQRWRTGQLYHFADNTQLDARAGATADWRGHTMEWRVHAGEFRHLSRRATSAEPVAGTGDFETQRLVEGDVAWSGPLGPAAFDAGVEARREHIRSGRVEGGSRTQDRAEAFVQTTFSPGPLQLVPGVRLSASQPWGSHWSPRVAAMLRPRPELALRASLGRGFRAPDFKEQFITFANSGPGFSYTVAGNPGLVPEQSVNYTAGIEWALDRVYVRGQWFRNEFDNFIETVEQQPGMYSYANVQDGRTTGIELETGITHGGLRVDAGYSWLDASRVATGEPLLGRPAHAAHAAIALARAGGLRGTLSASWTGRTPISWETGEDQAKRTAVYRAPFLNVNAVVGRELPAGLRLNLGVNNLLDQQPDHWPGFAGRQFFAGLNWSRRGAGSSTDRQP